MRRLIVVGLIAAIIPTLSSATVFSDPKGGMGDNLYTGTFTGGRNYGDTQCPHCGGVEELSPDLSTTFQKTDEESSSPSAIDGDDTD